MFYLAMFALGIIAVLILIGLTMTGVTVVWFYLGAVFVLAMAIAATVWRVLTRSQ